jgi:hypothetical protein
MRYVGEIRDAGSSIYHAARVVRYTSASYRSSRTTVSTARGRRRPGALDLEEAARDIVATFVVKKLNVDEKLDFYTAMGLPRPKK